MLQFLQRIYPNTLFKSRLRGALAGDCHSGVCRCDDKVDSEADTVGDETNFQKTANLYLADT